MKTKILSSVFFGALVTVAAGCGDEVVIGQWCGYGCSDAMPGADLDEGGEILLERLLIGAPVTGGDALVINQFHAFAFDGVGAAITGAAPGSCTKLSDNTVAPVHTVGVGGVYTDFGENIHLKGTGVDLDVPRVIAGVEGLRDNRPNPDRAHPEGAIVYGGAGWQDSAFTGDPLVAGAEYQIDLNAGAPLTLQFPRSYDVPFQMDTEVVQIPGTGDFVAEWQSLPNDNLEHARGTDFSFVAFAEVTEAGPKALYICIASDAPESDGSVIIPASVIAELPESAIIQAGRFTHWLDAVDNAETGTPLRLDLFAIWCNVGLYEKAIN